MPYGTIKVDTITFTDGGIDKSVSISGLTQNPTFTGNVTVTGTVSGATVRATTISGVTISGTTVNAASGVFTTQISGAVVVAPAGTVSAPSVQVGTGASIAPGLYGAGTDQLGISVAGSSRLVVDSVGQIRVVTLGSASAPALVVGNDLNTGLYSLGADQVAISTAGTGRLFVDASGNVGIGTSSPNRLFESSAATVDNFARINTTGATKSGIEFANGGTVYSQLYFNNVAPYDLSLFQQYSTGSLIFGTNSTERLRIDSSGRLLVGTSTDSGGALLQVNGNRIRVGTAKTPASATDTGTAGEICWDANYIYVCTATNTWKRTAIATW